MLSLLIELVSSSSPKANAYIQKDLFRSFHLLGVAPGVDPRTSFRMKAANLENSLGMFWPGAHAGQGQTRA